jgi:phage terminase large subunit-like protein
VSEETAQPSPSLIKRLVNTLGAEELLAKLTPEQRSYLRYEWRAWGRPNQLAPAWAWVVWLILAGRGFGKTRTGAEWVREQVVNYPFVNLIGATADDARDIMIEGESGILAVCPPGERPIYKKADRQLEWPNGAKSLIFTADEPDRLRGKQHMKLWADEVAAWRYEESWTQAMLGLRLGDKPQAVATTTPRPTPLIRRLAKAKTTHLTLGTTYDNRDNLAPSFYSEIISIYEGTRIGRQELMAEILTDTPGALWTTDMLDKTRVDEIKLEDMARVVVGVDPSGGSDPEKNDEQGIVVVGKHVNGHFYVLADVSCCKSPDGWGRVAIQAYQDYKADRIVEELNFGGEMVEFVISTASEKAGIIVPVKPISASRGKMIRAEPIAALYEQERVHHVGQFAKLESQMTSFVPCDDNLPKKEKGKRAKKSSPDRMDALVWAITELAMKHPVTLGEGPITSGDRRATSKPESAMDDEEEDDPWR